MRSADLRQIRAPGQKRDPSSKCSTTDRRSAFPPSSRGGTIGGIMLAKINADMVWGLVIAALTLWAIVAYLLWLRRLAKAQGRSASLCFGTVYRPGCLAALPWGDARFHCAVLLCDPDRAKVQTAELVRANLDWIAVAGRGSEDVHDAIDVASVACGRQAAVGNGSPMTSWDEDALTAKQMAEVVSPWYGEGWVLVLVIGNEADLHSAVAAVRERFGSFRD